MLGINAKSASSKNKNEKLFSPKPSREIYENIDHKNLTRILKNDLEFHNEHMLFELFGKNNYAFIKYLLVKYGI